MHQISQKHSPPAAVWAGWRLSVDHLLWIFILLVAAVLRLGRLGLPLFTPTEAAEAWRIWSFWSTDGISSTLLDPFSPAYFSLTALLTQIAGFSDGVMRVVPAAAGLLTVLAIYQYKSLLGELGALTAAFWIAVSPLLTWQSRTAGGDSLAILALVVLAGSVWSNRQTTGRHGSLTAAIALGFGLTTSPLFWTGAAGLLAALWWWEPEQGEGDPPAPPDLRPLWWGGGLAFLLSSSMLLWHLPGLGETADLAAGWLASFSGAFSGSGWRAFGAVVARYELIPILLAAGCAVWAVVKQPRGGAGIALWFGVTFLLAGLQNQAVESVGVVVIPAALLIGLAVERLRHRLSLEGSGFWIGVAQVASLLIMLLLIVAANLGRYARISTFDPADVAHLLLALLCLLVAIFIWLLLLVWDTRLGLGAGLLTVLLLGAVVQMGSAWRIGVIGTADVREPLLRETTDPALAVLVDTAVEASRELVGTEAAVSLFSAVDHPLLRWYLRDFERAEFGTTVPVQATYQLILTPETVEPNFGADYIGADFAFLRRPEPSPSGWLGHMRWFFFAEGAPVITQDHLVLWVRSDLLQRSQARPLNSKL